MMNKECNMQLKLGNVSLHPHGYKDRYKVIKPRLYFFFISGENVIENFFNRHDRPYNEYRKLIPDVMKKIGANPGHLSWKWSQKAGCSCGCSPGFIIDGWDPVISKNDVFVDITYE